MSVYRRGKVWYYDFEIGGVRHAAKGGETRKECEATVDSIRAAYRAAKLRKSIFDVDIPFSFAAQEYLKTCKAVKSKRTHDLEMTDYNKHLAPFFGGLHLHDISKTHLVTFQGIQKKKRYANRTINLHIGLVRKIRNHASEHLNKILPPGNSIRLYMRWKRPVLGDRLKISY